MTNLMRAHDELFRRAADERFSSLSDLWQHVLRDKEESLDLWTAPKRIAVQANDNGHLVLSADQDEAFNLNDWSFSQLSRLAGVAKDTVNRLSPGTAGQVFAETLPQGNKPLQLFTRGEAGADRLRSLHAASYTRLFNADLLSVVREFAVDFTPPQRGVNDATGLYCGEQDMFCFLIDPAGWTDIGGEAFAPGFFVWNSEVGRRSVGIQTFWFQAVCQNHIVWDAVEVVDFSRKHTANVHDALNEIRRHIERLVEKRDERRDGFVRVLQRAMNEKLGDDAEDAMKVLARSGMTRSLAKRALEIAQQKGALTIFAVVDALTQVTGQIEFGGDRTDADARASSLLALVA